MTDGPPYSWTPIIASTEDDIERSLAAMLRVAAAESQRG
jgi:hypothetical protein